jgi:DNA-binding NtrC family response regulator/predicted ATPase
VITREDGAVHPLAELVGESAAMVALREQVRQLLRAWSPSRRPPPVLIQGETGTGKGLLARSLHRASPRCAQPLVELNCAAVPESLLEAELFGYERGAFTDARQSKPGLLQLAHRGTLFLDEIGLLAPAMQAKLLSVIEDRAARRLGAVRTEPIDVWIVAATNEDLPAAIQGGAFREDLYHRLAVFTARLSPLRERGDDVLLLAKRALDRACADYGLPQKSLAADAVAALRAHAWPGNVRELENVIERAALLSDAARLTAAHLALPAIATDVRRPVMPVPEPLDGTPGGETLSQQLLAALTRTGWNVTRTAALLGISRNTVRARIARYGLRPPRHRPRGRPAADPGLEPAIEAQWRPLPAATRPQWEPRRLVFFIARFVGSPGEDSAMRRALGFIAEKIQGFGGRIEGQGATSTMAVFGLESVDDPALFAAHCAMVIRNTARHTPGVPAVTIGLHHTESSVRVDAASLHLDADAGRRAWNDVDAALEGAEGGDIVATATVADLLARRFALTRLHFGSGIHRIDGLWHARLGASRWRGPFVGRTEELALLESRLAVAIAGRGQVVNVAGDAGIGKSRLLVELVARPALEGARYLEGRCLPTETQTPFYPFLQIVRSACGLEPSDSPGVTRDKIATTIRDLALDIPELASDLTDLLDPDADAPSAPGAASSKKRFFTAVQRLLFGFSRRQPLVVAVEDLHWIDPSSEACLEVVVESMTGAAILLLTTYRLGYRTPWAPPHSLQLTLPPLSGDESMAVIRGVLDIETRRAELEHRIQLRAEGNPLFLEELSRAAAERHAGFLTERIPTTIEDTIAARLNRLPARHHELLTAAAVIGRDFSVQLLRAVTELTEETVDAALGHLQRADLLYRSDLQASEPSYTFKHTLVQEVAYGRLSSSERRALHVRVLETIERLFPERLSELVEQLAHHAVLGDERPRAVRYLFQSGQKAAARSALVEALSHLAKALELLRTLPEDPARDRQELDLQLYLAGAVRATKGFAAPDVGLACARAIELCRRLGDRGKLLPTLTGVYSFHLMRAEYARAGDAGAELLALGRELGNDEFEMIGSRAVGSVLFHTGRLVESRVTLERALALYRPEVHGSLAALHGTDHAQATSCFLGLTLWVLGYPSAALERLQWAVAHSERLGHTHSVGLALSYQVILLVAGRQFEAVPEPGQRLIDLSTRNSLTLLGIAGRFCVAAARQPRTRVTVDEMHREARAWWATGAAGYRPWVEAVLAEAHGELGDLERGLQLIADAAAHVQSSGERWVEPEIDRVRGSLLAADPRRRDESAAALRQALDLARQQQARMWELRAALHLARMLTEDGRPSDVRGLLEPVLAWFPAAAETPDLVAGRALCPPPATPGRQGGDP